MKDKVIIDDELVAKLNNKYLEEELIKYLELKNRLNHEDVLDEYYDQFYNLVKIFEYREVLSPQIISFLDNKLECDFKKGRLPEDFDFYNNDKIKHDPLCVIAGEKGNNRNNSKYIIICTSIEKMKKVAGYNMIINTTIPDMMDKYFDDYKTIKGIVINPYEESFFLDQAFCALIQKKITKEEWDDMTKKAIESMREMFFKK